MIELLGLGAVVKISLSRAPFLLRWLRRVLILLSKLLRYERRVLARSITTTVARIATIVTELVTLIAVSPLIADVS